MDIITAIFWTALSIALGYEVRGEEAIRGLPCIIRANQLFCINPGSQYPVDRIEVFIDENKALIRRMFGDFAPPGDFFNEVSTPPDIQPFQTIDFPRNLWPSEWSQSEDGLPTSVVIPANKLPLLRASVARESERERGRASTRTRTRTPRPTRVLTSLTKVVTNAVLPTKTQTPSPIPFSNVFLNQPVELQSQASTTRSSRTRRPRVGKTTNRRSRPRLKRSPDNSTMPAPPVPQHRRVKRQRVPTPPKIDKGSKNLVDSCESKVEIITPYWAANSAGEIRAIVNTKHFPQAIHQELCKGTSTSRCGSGCICEQKYTYHRLLAYDPDNDCKGIFIDWFLFPSCCACRCPP